MFFRSLVLGSLTLLAACGGGTGTTGTTGTTGASFVITDAATDDVDLFEVDVKGLTLTRLDDSTVSVMSKAARLDFAQLENVTELLVGANVPIGIYKKMTLTLDFANARVCLRGKTTTANILDEAGNAITGEVQVDVSFDTGSRPNAVIGRNHLFLFDLDLNSSLVVDLTNNSVTFSPAATAEFDPTNLKPIVTHGRIKEVDTTTGTMVVERRTLLGAVIGRFTVATTSTTVYQIDGRNYQGSTGLNTLSGVPVGSHVFVQGTLNSNSRRMTAIAIETGKGTPGNGQDYVIGHIVARDNGAGSNATLTVVGMSVDVSNSTRRFNTTHTVSVDFSTTRVLKRLNGTGLSTDSLNVGQRIAAFGNATGTAIDATGSDAVVRMLKTSVWGTSTGTPSGNTMTLNVSRFGLRQISDFNFNVGGTTQSTPTSFEVDVTGLNTGGISNNTRIRTIGFLNPVDVNGDRDMKAETIVNKSTTGALLLCQWVPAREDPITTSATEMTLDVSNALIKVVGDGFGTTTLTNSPNPPKIDSLFNVGVFRIIENRSVELHLQFGKFLEALNTRIGPNSKVFRVVAWGTRTANTQNVRAAAVTVILL